ncbi:acyl-CoA dehydrogenase [Blastococcus sp. CT_GayMR20]|uniref:acyl-CoA dehydrogenase n=1 Tax=Blastococcus sp. CT_GayMR20 TaxID=2559609 RepID=UPI001FD741E5|nr:acyl-CoA dehydrogenase [Blastococcus sp. CT_GayMR20]
MSRLMSRNDLAFLLHDWLGVTSLTSRDRYVDHDRGTFDAVLQLAEEVATRHFAPHNRRNDAEEPTFDGETVHMHPEVRVALDVLAGTGLIGSSADVELGGMQLPHVVATAAAAWFQAANIGTWSYALLTVANANLLMAHGSTQQVDTWVRPMLEGRFHGTMCLSEPQAGSSLADITTRAVKQEDGSYRLTGTKMWISGGDHDLGENIVHLVLARTPDAPPGVRGISLFLVPKFLLSDDGSIGERNDVVLAGLNHKMGYRGTTNTVLNFGEGRHTPGGRTGAVGTMVGAEGQGLAAMFHMMNEARIAIGAGAAALGYTGYLKSVDYARTRTQGRPLGAKDPSQPPVALDQHPDVRRMLLAQKSYVEGALAVVLFCSRLVDEQLTGETAESRHRASLLLEILTPIAKSWPSQWCLAANDLAIQVHGGYGYTREYDVEQHYRDNRLNPIHEGTHGIQGLDLLGRKVSMHNGAAFTALCELIEATLSRARGGAPHLQELAGAVGDTLGQLVDVTSVLLDEPDAQVRLANSSLYLEAVGHLVVGWAWLDQLLALGEREDGFAAAKRAAARYFCRYELPDARTRLRLLETLDRTTVDLDPSVL